MVRTRARSPEHTLPVLQTENLRRRALELESLYAGGPDFSPWLYETQGVVQDSEDEPRIRLRLGKTKFEVLDPNTPNRDSALEDIARIDTQHFKLNPTSSKGCFDALIGDPRNEDNLIVSQLTVAFHRFHNRLLDRLLEREPVDETAREDERWQHLRRQFDLAKGLTIFFYREVIVHDFLKRLTLRRVWSRYNSRYRRSERAGAVSERDLDIPAEFSMAGFRFGHVMAQNTYHFNIDHRGDDTSAQLSKLLEFSSARGDREDLPLRTHWVIDWSRFFFDVCDLETADKTGAEQQADESGDEKNFARKIRPAAASTMTGKKIAPTPSTDRKGGVLYRTLARGYVCGLWNGRELAKQLEIKKPISPVKVIAVLEEIAEQSGNSGAKVEADVVCALKSETPLFLYILAEAHLEGGEHLGELGSEIVCRVIFDQLQASPLSNASELRTLWADLFPESVGNCSFFSMPSLLRLIEGKEAAERALD